MVADGGGLEFLRFVEDGEVGGELLGPVDLEEDAERLQVVAFEEGVLGVGLIGEEFEEGDEVFLDVVHDFGLLVADVERSGGPVPGRGEVGVDGLLVGGVDVADALVEDHLPLPAHQLQHQNQQQHLRVHLAVLALHHPPQLLVVVVEQLLHQVLVLGQAQLRAAVEVGREVEQLRDGVPPGREEQVFKRVGQRKHLIFIHHYSKIILLAKGAAHGDILYKIRSLQLDVEPSHGDGHRLQRAQGVLDGELKHVVAVLLHLEVAVVGVVLVGQYAVLGGVEGLVGPFLQVGDLGLDLLLDVAEVDVVQLVVHGELVF